MKPDHDFRPQAIAVNHCPELVQDSSAGGQRTALLDEFAKGLCRELAIRLAPLLAGVLPVVAALPVETLSAKDLLRGAGETQAHFLIEDHEPDLRMVASIGVGQALSLTEFLFGGSGETTQEGMPDAELPRSCVLALEQVVAQLAWAARESITGAIDQSAIKADAISLVVNPLRNPPLPPGDCCLAWPISIAVDATTRWTIRLAGLEGALVERLVRGHARNRIPPDRDAVIASLGHIPLRVAATVAQFELPLSRLARLTVGDVFPIATVREIPLQVDGQVLAHGQLGAIDERCALRLSRLN